MPEPNLLTLSASAFAAVLLLLSLLALAVRALTAVFAPRPPTARPVDAATVAALGVAVHHALPGYRLGRIEETP
jgi:Na+-transporting methylmalonyl-CoA/oxaloacetate decarboxylase gamma subunit